MYFLSFVFFSLKGRSWESVFFCYFIYYATQLISILSFYYNPADNIFLELYSYLHIQKIIFIFFYLLRSDRTYFKFNLIAQTNKNIHKSMYNSTNLHVAPRSFNWNKSLTHWLYIFLLEYKQVKDAHGTLDVYK